MLFPANTWAEGGAGSIKTLVVLEFQTID